MYSHSIVRRRCSRFGSCALSQPRSCGLASHARAITTSSFLNAHKCNCFHVSAARLPGGFACHEARMISARASRCFVHAARCTIRCVTPSLRFGSPSLTSSTPHARARSTGSERGLCRRPLVRGSAFPRPCCAPCCAPCSTLCCAPCKPAPNVCSVAPDAADTFDRASADACRCAEAEWLRSPPFGSKPSSLPNPPTELSGAITLRGTAARELAPVAGTPLPCRLLPSRALAVPTLGPSASRPSCGLHAPAPPAVPPAAPIAPAAAAPSIRRALACWNMLRPLAMTALSVSAGSSEASAEASKTFAATKSSRV
eukprot:3251445-Pleurochrysis_carterae.AAC.6